MKKVGNEGKKLLHVAKYERVSSDRQAKTGDSLREQDETLNEYIKNRDDMVLYDTYIDDGISGQKLDRDDFSRLMSDISDGKVDVIIFTKLDRWFRSLRHYLNTQAFLEEHGVGWIAVRQEYYDTTTAYGRAFVAQSMTWAELEAQNDSERILAVFNNKVRNGEVISGKTPVGYKIENKHLVPDESNRHIVKEIFEYYAYSGCLSKLMLHMRNDFEYDRTVPTLRKMLKNTIYIGQYRGNDNYCEGIIDPELFNRVQNLLSCNIRQNKKLEYLFSGLLRCAECDSSISGLNLLVYGRKRNDGTRKRYYHKAYRCHNHYDIKKCPNSKVVYESVLERWLLENIQQCYKDYIADYQLNMAPIVSNAEKRKKLVNKLHRLKDLYLNELISLDEYKIDNAALQEQLKNIPADIVPMRNSSSYEKIMNLDIEEMYKSMNFEEKTAFWRSFIKVIYYGNDKVFRVVFY